LIFPHFTQENIIFVDAEWFLCVIHNGIISLRVHVAHTAIIYTSISIFLELLLEDNTAQIAIRRML
jgi:hypothetical protein